MKTLKISNGEIRIAFEFADLNEDAQAKVMEDQITFEIDLINMIGKDSPYYELAEKMDRMQTPWFLGQQIYRKHKDDLIETININGYLFDEDGEMLPICYHTKDNEIVRMTFGKKELPVEFI